METHHSLKVLGAHQENQVFPDYLVVRDFLEKMVTTVFPAPRDRQDPPVNLIRRIFKTRRRLEELQAYYNHLIYRLKSDQWDHVDHPGLPAQQDLRVFLDHQDLLENKDHRVQ